MNDAPARDPRADSPRLTVWPATPRSVGRARRESAAALAAWGLAGLEDAASLVLSELMTNAVRYARAPRRDIGTYLARLADGRGVRIEVHDPSPVKPEARASGPDDEGGRGLALVDALTGGRWGVADRPGPGKLVWAELVLDDGVPAQPQPQPLQREGGRPEAPVRREAPGQVVPRGSGPARPCS